MISASDFAYQTGSVASCPQYSDKLCPLEWPTFHHGQFLKSEDLTAIVAHQEKSQRLQRFTLGWGVASGFNVSVGKQKETGQSDSADDCIVTVDAGYAIDAWGHDVINPCPKNASINEWLNQCQRCTKEETQSKWSNEFCQSQQMEETESDPAAQDDKKRIAIDVYARYHQYSCHPHTIQNGSCRDHTHNSAYANTRTRSGARIVLKRGTTDCDPLKEAYHGWEEDLRDHLKNSSPADFSDPSKISTDQTSFQPIWYPGLRKQLGNKETSGGDVRWKLWLEGIASFEGKDQQCAEDSKDALIPLARVWISTNNENEREITEIDNFPPFRRPLKPSSLPAPFGCTNLFPWIGARSDSLSDLKHHLGAIPLQLEHLKGECLFDPDSLVYTTNHQEPLVVLLADVGNCGSRILGFKHPPTCLTQPKEALKKTKKPPPKQSGPKGATTNSKKTKVKQRTAK